MKPIFSEVRSHFPSLLQTNRGKPLVYLDSAASAQKPKQVIDAISHFYANDYANIHRGIYELSERSTKQYEAARSAIKTFINAHHTEEIIFVRGTTEGINLIAQTYGRASWKEGDEVIISEMEHHSNIVPWYLLSQQIGIVLKILPMTTQGELDIPAYHNLFSPRTKLVALSHASNVLGTIHPIKNMAAIAHAHNVPILIDGAQAVPHLPIDVQDMDCDFYVFSSHKLYGPTGIGILYAKKNYLEMMPPYQAGGAMIETVSLAPTTVTFAKTPQKFEAGTPDIAGAIGLHAAIRYMQTIGIAHIMQHEQHLTNYAEEKLSSIPHLTILGNPAKKLGVISFVIDSIHPHDLGTVLDHEGVAIRAGHHCAMPLMKRLGVPATVRASLGMYNNEEDIDTLIASIQLAMRVFA